MGCCSKTDDDIEDKCKKEAVHKPFAWNPTINNVQQIAYVRRLESRCEDLQTSYFSLTTQLARLQFRVRQLIKAEPCNRAKLVEELERVVFKELTVDQCRSEELPSHIDSIAEKMGDAKCKQLMLVNSIRCRIGEFPLIDEDYPFAPGPNPKKKKPSKCDDDGPLSNKSSATSTKKASQVSIKSRKSGGTEGIFEESSVITEDPQVYVFEDETSDQEMSFEELRNLYQRKCSAS